MEKYKNISSVPEQFLDERHQFTLFPILSWVKKLLISIIICNFHISFYLQQNVSNERWRSWLQNMTISLEIGKQELKCYFLTFFFLLISGSFKINNTLFNLDSTKHPCKFFKMKEMTNLNLRPGVASIINLGIEGTEAEGEKLDLFFGHLSRRLRAGCSLWWMKTSQSLRVCLLLFKKEEEIHLFLLTFLWELDYVSLN